jgi:hypothetical protein
LKTKNLTDSLFRTIRSIRANALVETRIEHADCLHKPRPGGGFLVDRHHRAARLDDEVDFLPGGRAQ